MITKEDCGTPNWQTETWEQRRTWLRSRFKRHTIARAKRRELENYLMHLASEPDKVAYDVEAETRRYGHVIQHFLQVRVTERSFWLSLAAFAVSLLAAVFTGIKAWEGWPR
jgi:hypothetical protein